MTNVQNTAQAQNPSPHNAQEALIEAISVLIRPLGYEVVHLEVQTHRQKTLRLFIDFQEARDGQAIGIEDCVKVTKALDEPLDALPEVNRVFGEGAYELEVSSPGVDRPLRTARDYERFAGRDVRVHVFRPLTADELHNAGYQKKNPKQKNFLGRLMGLRDQKIVLQVAATTKSAEEVSIPLPLISKANLEPEFDFGETATKERH
ncbi:MAG: hypothetical protein ACXWPM_12960 [Bdellovibrionota bacterium]